MEIGPFLNKWIHLLSIVFVLGAIYYQRFVALPVFAGSGFEESDTGRTLRRRWGIFVGVLWVVILVTGFINVYIVAPHVNKTYFMFLGMKIVLALVMFLGSLAISHPMRFLEKLQALRGQMLTLLAILGVIVLGFSAFLNMSRISGRGLEQRPPVAAPMP